MFTSYNNFLIFHIIFVHQFNFLIFAANKINVVCCYVNEYKFIEILQIIEMVQELNGGSEGGVETVSEMRCKNVRASNKVKCKNKNNKKYNIGRFFDNQVQ